MRPQSWRFAPADFSGLCGVCFLHDALSADTPNSLEIVRVVSRSAAVTLSISSLSTSSAGNTTVTARGNESTEEKTGAKPSEYLRDNLYITTSGVCSPAPLLCAILAVGAEHILFGTDYPFETIEDAAKFLDNAPISESDREKISFRNAEKLLRLGDQAAAVPGLASASR